MLSEVLLAICVVLIGIHNASGAVQFTPASFNASLGSRPVSLVCTDQVSAALVFLVNGVTIDDSIRNSRGIVSTNLNNTARRITIQPLLINDNLTVNCVSLTSMGKAEALLLVQGTLSAPPDPVIISSSPGLQQLSWSAPFTIDLTDQDPDILGYRVCYSVLSSSYPAQCSVTNMLTYSFLNVRLPLNFSISAINPAGEGVASSITHSSCITAPDTLAVDVVEVDVLLSESGNFTVSVTIQIPPQTQCYDAYQVMVQPSSVSGSSFTSPVLLPTRVDQQLQSIEIRHAFVELMTNAFYTATLTAINSEGETVVASNVSLSTYDVQGVSVEVVGAGAVRVTCSFLTNSMARGCQVTVCQSEVTGTSSACSSVVGNRSGSSSTAVAELTNLSEGTYAITLVEDVEQDQGLTAITDLTIFDLLPFTVTAVGSSATEELPSSIVTPGIGSQIPLVPDTQRSNNVAIIVGAVMGGVVVAVLIIIIVVICLILVGYRRKGKHTYNFAPPGGTHNKKFVDPDHVIQDNQLHLGKGVASLNRHSVIEVDLGVELGEMLPADSVYDSLAPEDPPIIPPKKSRGAGAATSPVLLSPPSGWEGPLDNLMQDEIQEICLTPPTEIEQSSTHIVETEGGVSDTRSVTPTHIKCDLAATEGSQESLLSQKPPTYAQVMHVTTPYSNRRPHDKTSVFYSEIRIDSPPSIPRKVRKTISNSSTSVDSQSRPSSTGSKEFHIRTSQPDDMMIGYRV